MSGPPHRVPVDVRHSGVGSASRSSSGVPTGAALTAPENDQNQFGYLRPRDGRGTHAPPSSYVQSGSPLLSSGVFGSSLSSRSATLLGGAGELLLGGGIIDHQQSEDTTTNENELDITSNVTMHGHDERDGVHDDDDDDDERDNRADDPLDSEVDWSDSDSGESQESASASDSAWYGHGRLPASHNSSVASRLVNLDEEISAHEQSAENARQQAKVEATRRKKQREQNASMPCPPMCGVSWGINGQLLYWSNLPLLTHYLVTNQRRRGGGGGATTGAKGNEQQSTNGTNGAEGHTSDSHRLMHTSPNAGHSDPSSHIDHEDEENAPWAGHSPNPVSLPLPSTPSRDAADTFVGSALLDVNEVLPRSYQDLLALPFVAAHLGYVVGEDTEDRLDDSITPLYSGETTPMIASPAHSEPTTTRHAKETSAHKMWPETAGTERKESDPNKKISPSTSSPSLSSSPSVHGLSSPRVDSAGVAAMSPPVAASTPVGVSQSGSMLDLSAAGIDHGISISSATGGIGSAGSVSAAGRVLRPSASQTNLSVPRSESHGSTLDLLAEPYDLIEEFEGDAAANNAGAATEDFFSSFYNSSIQLAVSAVANTNKNASSSSSAGYPGRSSNPFASVPSSSLTSPPSKSTVIPVPPLPSRRSPFHAGGDKKPLSASRNGSSNSLANSISPSASGKMLNTLGRVNSSGSVGSALSGGGGGASGTLSNSGTGNPNSVAENDDDAPTLAPHSWATLANTPADNPNYTRKRIRINTTVLMMDCRDIMPCSYELAQQYTLTGVDSLSVCISNRDVCSRLGRFDLAEMWQLAAIISQTHQTNNQHSTQAALTPWNEHPMGGRLAEQLIQQYLRIGDIQTVAMLVSTFSFDSSSHALLPSRPHPTEIEVYQFEGVWDATPNDRKEEEVTQETEQEQEAEQEDTDDKANGAHRGAVAGGPEPLSASSSRHSPSPSSSSVSSVGLGLGTLYSPHPMSLLPATVDGSSRTWGPGSKLASSTRGGGSSSSGFALAQREQAIKSNWSSGTASPNDPLYNVNSMQRARWRSGGGYSAEDYSSQSQARLRSGSFNAPRSDIPRIEEGEQHSMSIAMLPTPQGIANRQESIAEGEAEAGPHTTNQSTDTKESLDIAPTKSHTLRLDQLDLYLYIYAEYLYRLGLYTVRSKVLKFLSDPQSSSQHLLTGFSVDDTLYGLAALCHTCGREQERRPTYGPTRHARGSIDITPEDGTQQIELMRGAAPQPTTPTATAHAHADVTSVPVPAKCASCYHYPLLCSICSVSVRGIYLMCVLCGHGGHPDHLSSWFRSSPAGECPTACGCRCEADGGLQQGTCGQTDARAYKHAMRRRKKDSRGAFLFDSSDRYRHSSSTSIDAQFAADHYLRAAAAAAAEEDHDADPHNDHIEQMQHFYNPAA